MSELHQEINYPTYKVVFHGEFTLNRWMRCKSEEEEINSCITKGKTDLRELWVKLIEDYQFKSNVVYCELPEARERRVTGICVDSEKNKYWLEKGELYRVGGPAVEGADGSKTWYKNDKPHRVGGPAVIYADGTKEWWEKGKQIR